MKIRKTIGIYKTLAKILQQGNFCIPRSLSSLMFARNNKNFLSAKVVWRNLPKLRIYISAIFIYLLSFTLCLAQDIPISFDEDVTENVAPNLSYQSQDAGIKLLVNESKVLDKKAKRVAVGNPEVADVRVINDKEIMLLGKSKGRTNLIIWDKFDRREILPIVVDVVSEDLQGLVNYLNEIVKAAGIDKVQAVARGEKVVLVGSVSGPAEMEQLNKLSEKIEGLINVVRIVPPSQVKPKLVQIDVEVLEISKTALREIGVAYSQTIRLAEIANLGSADDWLNTFSQLSPGLIRIGRWQHSAIAGKLSMLFEEGKARLLSHPKLVTNSGKQANFRAGGEIPITVSGENPHIEWKPYGVFLKIEPTVVFGDDINAKLKADVSSLDWAYATKSRGNTPAIKTRNAETEVNIKQGETLLIAGLIQNDQAKALQKFPFLGNIPILGELFKSTRFQNNQTELVIFVTPTIISEEERDKKEEQEEKGVESEKQRAEDEEKETAKMLALRDEMKKRLAALRQGEQRAREVERKAREKREELLALVKKVEELGKENEEQARSIRKSLSAKMTKQEENLEKVNDRIREKLEQKIIHLENAAEEAKKQERAAIQKRKKIKESIRKLESQIEGESISEPRKQTIGRDIENEIYRTRDGKEVWSANRKRDYARDVQREISNFIVRPKETEDLEGTTVLKMHILPNGRLKEAKLLKSSGYASLDKNALRGVRKASPYPLFPASIGSKGIWLKLPITFKKELVTQRQDNRNSDDELRSLEREKKILEEKLKRRKERKIQEEIAELKEIEQEKKADKDRFRSKELEERKKELKKIERKQREVALQLEKEMKQREVKRLREELNKEKEKRRRIQIDKQRLKKEKQRKMAVLKKLEEKKRKLVAKKQKQEERRRRKEQAKKQKELARKKKIEKRVLSKYIPRLQEEIRQAAAYLPEVKSDKSIKEATAILNIHFLSNGHIDKIKIKQPSQFSLFDEVLARTIKKASPYLSFPKAIERKDLWIEIPITYKKDYPLPSEGYIEKEREMSRLLNKLEKKKNKKKSKN